MEIVQASLKDIEPVSILFAYYREFYKQPYNIDLARNFIKERLTESDSVIFIAIENGEYVGFTQLYPSFTSIGVAKIWILNDLFVLENYRKKGIARHLINHVFAYSVATNRKKVALSTAHDNLKAQSLYEKLGFVHATHYNYEKTI